MQSNSPRPNSESSASNNWLETRLSQQAKFLSSLPLTNDTPVLGDAELDWSDIPTVYQLRERTIRKRERRARVLSFASTAAVLISIFGWGIHSAYQHPHQQNLGQTFGQGELPNIRTVSNTNTKKPTPNGRSFQMTARWWEPVTVEWVDSNGQSMGIAGVVAEERTSTFDPRELSDDELKLLETYLAGSQSDEARNHFTRSLEPAF